MALLLSRAGTCGLGLGKLQLEARVGHPSETPRVHTVAGGRWGLPILTDNQGGLC